MHFCSIDEAIRQSSTDFQCEFAGKGVPYMPEKKLVPQPDNRPYSLQKDIFRAKIVH